MADLHRFIAREDAGVLNRRFATAFRGQRVCVTGAGGDIGSALTKALRPDELDSLTLLDSSEHGLFQIGRYMEAMHPRARCRYVLGSVEDEQLLAGVFERERPQMVFHAAGSKHVGLLEHNPWAAVRNNVLGTYALIRAALEHGVSTFAMLSTDKAVNPHSAMGVSKRIAELLTVSLSGATCKASAIRLGNVIGSRGSVVPIFLEQIASGALISVTHPQAARYFFTRAEAVDAILATGAAACDGKILIPSFLPPVLVAELAQFLVTHHGQSSTEAMRFTGLRPGEKLTEELVYGDEQSVGKIDGPLTVMSTKRLSPEECDEAVRRLAACVGGCGDLVAELCRIVPEYVPSELMRTSAAHFSRGRS